MKAFFVLLFSVATLVTSYANPDDSTKVKKKIMHGFHVGVTKTTLEGTEVDLMLDDPGAYQDEKIGVEIGWTMKYNLNDYFILKSGVNMTQKRSYIEDTGFIYPLQADLKFLNVPLIFGIQPLNLSNSGNINFSLEGGLIINVDMGSSDNMSIYKGLSMDNDVERKTIVPAYAYGASLEIKLSDRLMFVSSFKHSKDLVNYFNRRYTWYSTSQGKEVYKDYYYKTITNHMTFGLTWMLKK